MDVVVLVDGVDGQDHLCHVEPSHVLRQPVLKLTEQGQQVPAHVVVHHQVLETDTGTGRHEATGYSSAVSSVPLQW